MYCTRAIAVALVSVSFLAASDACAQAAAKAAKSIIHDIVVFKDGSSINGEVKVDVFVLKMKQGTLNIPKSDILEIEYKKLPNTPDDQVQISAGTRVHGDLSPANFKVNVDGLGDIDVVKTDILAIMPQRPIEDLGEAMKKSLGRTKGK